MINYDTRAKTQSWEYFRQRDMFSLSTQQEMLELIMAYPVCELVWLCRFINHMWRICKKCIRHIMLNKKSVSSTVQGQAKKPPGRRHAVTSRCLQEVWLEGDISWRFIYNYLWLTLFQKTLVQHFWPCHFFAWKPPLASFVLEIKPTVWPTGLMQSSSLSTSLSSHPGFAPESYTHNVPSTSGPLPILILLLKALPALTPG